MATNTQENISVDRVAEISKNIRQAIRNALPTPPEQFLTIMVPGKVVNFGDYTTDDASNAILPRKTELNQAVLCDDMPALSSIQMGPTGKSVARSYANAIGKLVAAGTTVGVDDGKEKTVDQKRYEQGMKFLSTALLDRPGQQTLVELYTEKQAKYTQAVENKTKAFGEALQRAKNDPANTSTSRVREAYDKWVDENARTYRAYVQAAYMDWVITGRKEEVEYWFSVVDQDSALAQVERSKEVMRWAVIQDVDGSCEYQKVKLEPSDWANKCFDKINKGTNKTKTVEWYNWEISRLEKTVAMLEAPPAGGDDQAGIDKELKEEKTKLGSAILAYKTKQQEYQAIPADKDKAAEKNTAKEAFDTAKKELDNAKRAFDEVNVKSIANQMKGENLKMFPGAAGEKGLINQEISSIQEQIRKYKEKLSDLVKTQGPDKSEIQGLADDLGISKPAPDPTSEKPDPFTPITVSVSASSATSKTESSATSFSASASASWGFTSVAASVSHSEAHTKATNELASSDVKVSFECMRVDINRPWLRPELFYDEELIPADKVKISPGFSEMKRLMENSLEPAQDCGMFPMYPVSFIVACNVVLEISGSTSSLQTYMNDSSTSASVSVGYGCFLASGSGSHSRSDAGSTCKATASGCRIEIKSPQIIGWVSQLVPALPRLSSSKAAVPAAHP